MFYQVKLLKLWDKMIDTQYDFSLNWPSIFLTFLYTVQISLSRTIKHACQFYCDLNKIFKLKLLITKKYYKGKYLKKKHAFTPKIIK